jgi:hypothetical protein
MFEDPANTAKKALVLTPAGKEALNLPSADTVILLQRLASPGDELQAEDRINRPQQKNTPKAIYLIPNDPLSMILTSRAERKRSSMLASLGESPDDDFSRSVKVPWDMKDLERKLRGLSDERSFASAYNVGIAVLSLLEIYTDEAFAVLLKQAETTAEQKLPTFVFPTLSTVNRRTIRISLSNRMREYLSSVELHNFMPSGSIPSVSPPDWLVPANKKITDSSLSTPGIKTVQLSHILTPTLLGIPFAFNMAWLPTKDMFAAVARAEKGVLNFIIKFVYFAESESSHRISLVPFDLLSLQAPLEANQLVVPVTQYPQMKVIPAVSENAKPRPLSMSEVVENAIKSKKTVSVTWLAGYAKKEMSAKGQLVASSSADVEFKTTDGRLFRFSSGSIKSISEG